MPAGMDKAEKSYIFMKTELTKRDLTAQEREREGREEGFHNKVFM